MRTKNKQKLLGEIQTLYPYWSKELRTWCFDDDKKNIVAEPFLWGMPEIIDTCIEYMGLDVIAMKEYGRLGMKMDFTDAPYAFVGVPDETNLIYYGKLHRIGLFQQGCWYRFAEDIGERFMYGWLCSKLYEYFKSAPLFIYFKATCLIENPKKKATP